MIGLLVHQARNQLHTALKLFFFIKETNYYSFKYLREDITQPQEDEQPKTSTNILDNQDHVVKLKNYNNAQIETFG